MTGFAIVLQELQTLQGKLTSPINLEAIDAKRQTEIDNSVYPQDMVFGQDIVEIGTHGIQPDIGTDAKGGGEEPRHTLPITRDVALGPRYT